MEKTIEQILKEQRHIRNMRLKRRREAKARLLEPHQLTDRRFMSRPQREAYDRGEEIWV